MESMDDYKEELEASFRRIREGDILTGTVIDVNEEGVTLDLKYYAPGFISAEEMSSDPDFSLAEAVHVGDTIEATVIRVDDGAGNILLSGMGEAQRDDGGGYNGNRPHQGEREGRRCGIS